MNCFATIVSANYLAYAKVLAESVQKHQPGTAFQVLIVDRATDKVKSAVSSSGLAVTYAEDLGISDFEQIAFKYELVELNTALKPTFLKRLFAQGFEKVVYLDPDICLFSSLAPVLDALDEDDIVLTPHAVSPAMDGLRPSDIDFLRNGTFNLGFVALRRSKNAESMLNWWEERCLAYGFNDLGFGTFVDQKWMDLVPCYFDGVKVFKHKGCNVAYWNLHERELSGHNGNYRVDDAQLCFFHFSGVKADKKNVLSRHQTRHAIVPGSTLAELVAAYCESLLRLGHEEYSEIDYTFGYFSNNVPIPMIARRAACFISNGNDSPFSESGVLFLSIKKCGLLAASRKLSLGENTLTFDQDSLRVKLVNKLLRIFSLVIGVERLSALARYMAILNRESNLARVLLGKPFDFSHQRNKTRT